MSSKPKHVLLITGAPGVGKTTLIREVAEAIKYNTIGGFYTEEIRHGGVREGFRLITFNGNEQVIAHIHFDHRYHVSKYGVDVTAINRFTESTLTIDESIDLYLVDEIGKMECYSERFTAAIRALLDSDKPLVATVAKTGGGLIDEVKQRPDCVLWEVTRANRDTLALEILAWLGRWL